MTFGAPSFNPPASKDAFGLVGRGVSFCRPRPGRQPGFGPPPGPAGQSRPGSGTIARERKDFSRAVPVWNGPRRHDPGSLVPAPPGPGRLGPAGICRDLPGPARRGPLWPAPDGGGRPSDFGTGKKRPSPRPGRGRDKKFRQKIFSRGGLTIKGHVCIVSKSTCKN